RPAPPRLVDLAAAPAPPARDPRASVPHSPRAPALSATGLGRGQQLPLRSRAALGFALPPAEPPSADPRGQGRHPAAAQGRDEHGRHGTIAEAGCRSATRLRHEALVRTLARPLADRYCLTRRACFAALWLLSGDSESSIPPSRGPRRAGTSLVRSSLRPSSAQLARDHADPFRLTVPVALGPQGPVGGAAGVLRGRGAGHLH